MKPWKPCPRVVVGEADRVPPAWIGIPPIFEPRLLVQPPDDGLGGHYCSGNAAAHVGGCERAGPVEHCSQCSEGTLWGHASPVALPWLRASELDLSISHRDVFLKEPAPYPQYSRISGIRARGMKRNRWAK